MAKSYEPAHALSQAAESVREFNHATISTGESWQYPGHAYDAIGNLSYLAGMLSQAIEQATRPVMHTHKHGRILIDNGGDSDQKVRELVKARQDAMRAAAALTGAVQRMHNATAPMGLDATGLPGFED
jgi:hypothetical protein